MAKAQTTSENPQGEVSQQDTPVLPMQYDVRMLFQKFIHHPLPAMTRAALPLGPFLSIGFAALYCFGGVSRKWETVSMGCWGITALESDNGLDAVRCVRYNLPADGQLDLGEMLERLKKDRWNAPCDVKLGCAHTSPMALAEIVVKYLDGDPGSLDYDEEWAAEDNKFRSITSFTASRASLRELRDYLADTLKYARIRAERQIKAGELPGGWFDPKDWDGWQKHMEGLIHRLDGVLALEGSTLELAHPPAPTVPELTM